MKIILFIAVSFFPLALQAQDMVITTRQDTTQRSIHVSAESVDALFYNGGSIKIENLATVRVTDARLLSAGLTKKLKNASVTLIIGGVKPITDSDISAQLLAKSDIESMELNIIFDTYRAEAIPAKVLQFLGAASLATGFIVAHKEANDLKNGKIKKGTNTPYTFQVIGGGAMAIGFVLDISSLHALRKKQKK